MIQRIQSLLLLLAVAANIPVLFLVLGDVSNTSSMEGGKATLFGNKIEISGFDEATMQWTDKALSMADDKMLLGHIALVALSSLVLFASIFLFKNRKLQINVVTGGLVLLLLQIVVMVLLFQTLPDRIKEPDLSTHNVGAWMVLPAVAVLLSFFARRRIHKDEKMVRDMDRIR